MGLQSSWGIPPCFLHHNITDPTPPGGHHRSPAQNYFHETTQSFPQKNGASMDFVPVKKGHGQPFWKGQQPRNMSFCLPPCSWDHITPTPPLCTTGPQCHRKPVRASLNINSQQMYEHSPHKARASGAILLGKFWRSRVFEVAGNCVAHFKGVAMLFAMKLCIHESAISPPNYCQICTSPSNNQTKYPSFGERVGSGHEEMANPLHHHHPF